MSEFFLTEKDQLPLIRANLSLVDDSYLDLSGGTGYFIYRNKYNGNQPVTGNADFLGPTSGYVQYQFTSGDVAQAGVFYGKWRIVLNNKQISFPNDSFLTFSLAEDLYSL